MTTFLITGLFLAVVVLGVLVLGVLRVQAETLRRLAIVDRLEGRTAVELPSRSSADLQGHDISGLSPVGSAVGVAVQSSTASHLLAFLSTGCTTCQQFWDALRAQPELPNGVQLILVTKDRSEESPSRVMELASEGGSVVMSSAAWSAYEVPAAPYFVYVGKEGRIRGEGTAKDWKAVESLFRDALLDERLDERYDFTRLATSPVLAKTNQVNEDDNALRSAGILPGDSSLTAPYGAEDQV